MTSIHDRDGTEPRKPKSKTHNSTKLFNQFENEFESHLKRRLARKKIDWDSTDPRALEIHQFRDHQWRGHSDEVKAAAAETIVELRGLTAPGETGNLFEDTIDAFMASPHFRKFSKLVLRTNHA